MEGGGREMDTNLINIEFSIKKIASTLKSTFDSLWIAQGFTWYLWYFMWGCKKKVKLRKQLFYLTLISQLINVMNLLRTVCLGLQWTYPGCDHDHLIMRTYHQKCKYYFNLVLTAKLKNITVLATVLYILSL